MERARREAESPDCHIVDQDQRVVDASEFAETSDERFVGVPPRVADVGLR